MTFFILHHFPVLFLPLCLPIVTPRCAFPLCLPLCLQGRRLKREQLLTPVVSKGFRQRARARLRRQEHQDRSKKRIQIVTCPIIEQTFWSLICLSWQILTWMILGVSEKKDMSEACARFISWTQFGPLGLFGPLNAKQNIFFHFFIFHLFHFFSFFHFSSFLLPVVQKFSEK